MDGISAMALCASRVYHEHFPEVVTRRKAAEALAIIGSVGFSTTPLPKRTFAKTLGPPLQVWDRLLKEMAAQPAVMAGCLFGMMLSTQMGNQHEENERLPNSRKISRQKIIETAFANEGLRSLKVFPQIELAVKSGTVLG